MAGFMSGFDGFELPGLMDGLGGPSVLFQALLQAVCCRGAI